MKRGLSVLGLAVVAVAANAQAVFTSGLYTQDFDSLATSGNNTLVNQGSLGIGATLGWAGNPSSSYRVSDGGATAGAIYSMGSVGNSERALGALASGSVVPQFGVEFQNNTGAVITSITVSFDGEQWRSPSNSSSTSFGVSNQRLTFGYSVNATFLTNGTWVGNTALDVVSGPNNTTVNSPTIGYLSLGTSSATITFGTPIAVNGKFWLRWQDTNDAANDAMFGIDNLNVRANSPGAVPEPFTMGLGLAGAGVFIRRRMKK